MAHTIYSKAGADSAIAAAVAAIPAGGGAVDSVNGQTGTVVLDASDVGADAAGTAAGLVAALDIPAAPDLSGYVPTSRTVNGKALTGNVSLDAADVGALPDTYAPDLSGYTPTSGLADVATSGSYADLSNKPTIPDSPDDIGAAATSHTHDDRYYTETEADARFALADSALQASTAQAINAQTGTSYTLVSGDAGKVVTLSNAGAITLNAPGSTFTAGQRIDVLVIGAGMATVVGTSGATANGTPSLVSRAQWSAFTILWTSSTACVVIGDLA